MDTEDTAKTKKSKRLIGILTLIFILIGIGWFLLWFFYLSFHETTDDAYTNGNLVSINASVPGSVIAFYADDTDLVVEGELLAKLDPTDYQFQYDKELAELAAVVLDVRQLYDRVLAASSNVEVKRISFTKAQYDHNNRKELIDSKAISNEDFVHSKDDLTMAENALKQAEYELSVAIDAVGSSSLEKHPKIEKQKAVVRDAYYKLQHTSIFAPTTGFVAKRAVNVGQWATPTTDLMAVIPADYVWVDANFKETQLASMRIGQPATVTLDIYGSSVKYTGKVLGIASGTGSVFSLIPPQNATGNWIKIVQRLPVRISLDPETVKKYPIRVGLSANVDIDITDQDLPYLAEIPKRKAVATTNVYDIDIEKVDRTIDAVIEENLKNGTH